MLDKIKANIQENKKSSGKKWRRREKENKINTWFSQSVSFYLSIQHIKKQQNSVRVVHSKSHKLTQINVHEMLDFSMVGNHHVETHTNTHILTKPFWCDAMRQMWQNYINIKNERTGEKENNRKKNVNETDRSDVTFPSDQLTFICGPFRRCTDFRQTFFMFQSQGEAKKKLRLKILRKWLHLDA